MVAHQNCRATHRNVVGAGDRKLGERNQFGSRKSEREFLQLGADDRHLGHPGRHIKIDDRPTTRSSQHLQARIGVHSMRMPHCFEQRRVIHAVAVCRRCGQVDAIGSTPLADCGKFAARPHEPRRNFTGVQPAGIDFEPGGNHIVETQRPSKLIHEVIWRSGGQHHLVALGAMTRDGLQRKRLHHCGEFGNCCAHRFAHQTLRLALHGRCTLAGQQHHRQRFADGVKRAEHQRFERYRPGHQRSSAQRSRNHGACRSFYQRAIEVNKGS